MPRELCKVIACYYYGLLALPLKLVLFPLYLARRYDLAYSLLEGLEVDFFKIDPVPANLTIYG